MDNQNQNQNENKNKAIENAGTSSAPANRNGQGGYHGGKGFRRGGKNKQHFGNGPRPTAPKTDAASSEAKPVSQPAVKPAAQPAVKPAENTERPADNNRQPKRNDNDRRNRGNFNNNNNNNNNNRNNNRNNNNGNNNNNNNNNNNSANNNNNANQNSSSNANSNNNNSNNNASRNNRRNRFNQTASFERTVEAAETPAFAPETSEIYDFVGDENFVSDFDKRSGDITDTSADVAPAVPAEPEKQVEVIGVKFRDGGKAYYFSPDGIAFLEGDHAIVKTVRGTEYGSVTMANRMVPEKEIVPPLKPVVRKATEADSVRYAQNRELELAARPVWEEQVKKNGLTMQLVDVEYTFDNAKLIFYFTADGRVDFRDLVKDLASVFRTRIELRQIGVRDEAKLLGGIGVCGRPFCCKTFLADFSQVSIKMAKEQNLSLSSAKISGTCGRLMCCLRFEHEVYEQEYATFPKVDSVVMTQSGRGVIIESNFLTGKVKVRMSDAGGSLKTFTPSEVKIIGRVRNDNDVDKNLLELEDK